MPVKTPPRTHYSKKKPNKHFLKVYWPYLPLAVNILLSLFISIYIRPQYLPNKTLAYATNISVQGLLQATNDERLNHGREALKLDTQLINAAQSKADHMAKNNYWAHVAPDGTQPWYFFDNAGYRYLKAGENLAYGFDNYTGTVQGWMNSPSHRDNLLDTSFTDVGFGIANMSNYQGNGPQTIVVAHYGQPLSANLDSAGQSPGSDSAQGDDKDPVFAGSSNQKPKNITLAQLITKGKAMWANNFLLGSIVGGLGVILIFKHGFSLRKAFIKGERFILHHPLLDATILSYIVLGILLTQNIGSVL